MGEFRPKRLPENDRTPLANSPDWLKAAPMWENLLASWRQSGQKQDHCPSLLNHNAKYKRLLPPYCDFANGVRSFSGSHDSVAFLPFQLEPPLRFNKMRAAAPTSRASHPETVEAGLAVTKLGRSSVTYAMDIFKQGGAFAAAQGHLIHVYVDRATQRPTDTKSLRGGVTRLGLVGLRRV